MRRLLGAAKGGLVIERAPLQTVTAQNGYFEQQFSMSVQLKKSADRDCNCVAGHLTHIQTYWKLDSLDISLQLDVHLVQSDIARREAGVCHSRRIREGIRLDWRRN